MFVSVTLVSQRSGSEPKITKVNWSLSGWLQGANELSCTKDILLLFQA